MKKCENTKQNICNDYCYARKGGYKLDFFVKTKFFTNFNDLMVHLKHQNCQLLSTSEKNGYIKATIRYKL